jgi:hypothetical protein
MAHVIDRDKWARAPDRWPQPWQGESQCGAYGSKSCLIFNYLPESAAARACTHIPIAKYSSFAPAPGCSPSVTGKSRASAGQILIVPPNTPHKFTNLGPGPLETTDIHENGSFITEWLEP